MSCKSEEQYDDMFLLEEANEELLLWETLYPGISSPILIPKAVQSLDTDVTDVGIGIYFKGNIF